MSVSFVFYNVVSDSLYEFLRVYLIYVLWLQVSLANLNANTVSFYQISKIATAPAVILLNYTLLNKVYPCASPPQLPTAHAIFMRAPKPSVYVWQTTSLSEMFAVAILLAGVSLATVNEVFIES